MMFGSHRGLYLPVGWETMPGPVYLPEGMSDTAALLSTGRCAIGRPSAQGGTPYLVKLLRKHKDREIIVVGENDQKSDGTWPGRTGMENLVKILVDQLGRKIGSQMPPPGYKDTRTYLSRKETAPL